MKMRFTLLFVGLVSLILNAAAFFTVKDLRYENERLRAGQKQIVLELEDYRKDFLEWQEFVKKSGLTPFYNSILEVDKGDKANEISEQQLHFNMLNLLKLDQSKFYDAIDHIMNSLKIRLFASYKDSIKLSQKTTGAGFFSKDNVLRLARVPSIWPTEGTITSLFGMRKHPISGKMKNHEGVDIGNLKSTDIVAAADGKVVFSGIDKGYGNTVIIDHGIGYRTLYGHAEKLIVKEGDAVKKGDVIAKMGSTGLSTGPHLHYEIMFAGIKVDPVMFVN